MKEITVQSFREYYQASVFLEEQVERLLDNGYEDIKGEIALIDGNWRVGVVANDRQFEMDV